MEISESFKKIIWPVHIFHTGFHIILMPWIFSVSLLVSVVPLDSGKIKSLCSSPPCHLCSCPWLKAFNFFFILVKVCVRYMSVCVYPFVRVCRYPVIGVYTHACACVQRPEFEEGVFLYRSQLYLLK